jgi:hypothetical protein
MVYVPKHKNDCTRFITRLEKSYNTSFKATQQAGLGFKICQIILSILFFLQKVTAEGKQKQSAAGSN